MSRRAKPKYPSSIEVLGKKFKIIYSEDLEFYGETNGPERVIKISKKCSEDQIVPTLLHEIIHASLYVGGLTEVLDGKTEEAIVVCLENALADIVNLGK